ncbi:MAG: SH3 domain-containing protein [Acidaminococcaceae bacterium]|nr:SH3 domain-containing protein [Acidaminococcaceae bacterium]
MKEMNQPASLKRFSAVTVLLSLAVMLSVFRICGAAGTVPRSAEAVLQGFGIQGPVTCSTYGHNPNGFMAQANGKNYIVDLKNNRVASIENSRGFFEQLKWQNRKKSDDTIIAQFLIYNDSHDRDYRFGEWRGSHHFFPLYILTTLDSKGSLIVDGKVSSGEGASPSHYHGYPSEQKNIELAELFVSEVFPFVEAAGFKEATPEKWPGNYPGMITGNEVNVRTGPGINFKSLGVFFNGDEVTLLSRTLSGGDVWYEVKYYNNQYGWIQGWVYGDYIEER